MAKVSRYQRSSLKKQRKVAMKRNKPAKRYAYRPINNSKGTNPASMVIHNGIGFPDRFRTKLSWSESIVLTGFGTSITQSYAVGMNNPYDPQTALGGNQPAYWDQLISIYKTAVVVGSKMTATFGMPTTATAGDGPYIVGIHCNNSSSLPTTDAPTLLSASNTGYALLGQGDGVKDVTQTYSPMGSLGRTKDNIQLYCASTSGPAIVYNGLVFASPQGTATTGSVNAVITIEFIVEFFNSNDIVDV